MKQQILRLIIAHPEPSVKCIHLELFQERKSQKSPSVTVLTVSIMESEMACSIKSKMQAMSQFPKDPQVPHAYF